MKKIKNIFLIFPYVIISMSFGELNMKANIKKELIEQKKSKFKGNIYHFTQVNFAYNSNKMEAVN